MADLKGKKVAILVDDYFEEAEFTGPLDDLKNAGAEVDVVAPKTGEVHSMHHAEVSKSIDMLQAA